MNSRFAYNPTRLDITRSRFKARPQHKTSINMSYLVPILCEEVLPADTWKVDIASLVRMSTPIAPLMDNLHQEYWAFFVPTRLVWKHTEEFYGANKTGPWANLTDYTIPAFNYGSLMDTGEVNISAMSIGDYLGYPIMEGQIQDYDENTFASILPLRAYALIWNEWFRDENVSGPIVIDDGDDGSTGYADVDSSFSIGSEPLKVSKYFDYFTGALPAPQKGSPVSVGLTGFVPLITNGSNLANLGGSVNFGINPTNFSKLGLRANTGTLVSGTDESAPAAVTVISKSNLGVDLSEAASITINQLRYAFQLQKLLERDARGGTRFFEMLQAHFGVTSPDSRLQRPEYLGGFKAPINIDQVLNTTGHTDSSSTQVGQTGAVSVTGVHKYLFTKSFTEPGYLFILTAVRQDQTYSQGLRRMFTRRTRFDFYYPEFANIGEQPIMSRELKLSGAGDNVFGYQEAWAEYRYIPNRVSGLLNPNAPNSDDFWTLANKFEEVPLLSSEFIQENRDNIQRALVSGSNGPDFKCDYLFNITMTRPMPMYSIPGLIDHH